MTNATIYFDEYELDILQRLRLRTGDADFLKDIKKTMFPFSYKIDFSEQQLEHTLYLLDNTKIICKQSVYDRVRDKLQRAGENRFNW